MGNQIEIWKDVIEFDNKYQISNFGRLKMKSFKINSSVQKCGFRINKEKIKPPQDNGNGYKQFYVQINGKRILKYAHRLVATYFIENDLNLPEVNHKDGNKSNNCVGNLEWSTKNDNVIHAVKNNLIKKGSDTWSSKLSEQNVLAIRRLYKINPYFNKTNVAKKLGVKDTTIHKIIRNQRWKHL